MHQLFLFVSLSQSWGQQWCVPFFKESMGKELHRETVNVAKLVNEMPKNAQHLVGRGLGESLCISFLNALSCTAEMGLTKEEAVEKLRDFISFVDYDEFREAVQKNHQDECQNEKE